MLEEEKTDIREKLKLAEENAQIANNKANELYIIFLLKISEILKLEETIQSNQQKMVESTKEIAEQHKQSIESNQNSLNFLWKHLIKVTYLLQKQREILLTFFFPIKETHQSEGK
jgi:hypothetical protein